MMRKYFTILSQNKTHVHKCTDVIMVSHSSSDYLRPFWIVTGDKNQFILGCYKTDKQALRVIREIFESDGKYEMPMWNKVKGD